MGCGFAIGPVIGVTVREDSCVDMFNVLFSVLLLCFCSESVRKVVRVCLCYRKDVLD